MATLPVIPGTTPLVQLDGTAFAYGRRVVVEADLTFDPGCFVGLVGPSGAGKTTLLRAIVGDIHPVAGAVRVGGQLVGRRPHVRVGYVPQLATVDWNFPITVAQTVLLGLTAEAGPWPWSSRDHRRRLHEVLERLGIDELASRPIRALSGGQQQRVFLARALIRRPELILLDEPTSGVDTATRREILDLLHELNGDGMAIILTTHDLNTVANRLPDLICLNRRVIARGTPADVLTPEMLAATFRSEMVVFRHDGLLLTADIPSHRHVRAEPPEHRHAVRIEHPLVVDEDADADMDADMAGPRHADGAR